MLHRISPLCAKSCFLDETKQCQPYQKSLWVYRHLDSEFDVAFRSFHRLAGGLSKDKDVMGTHDAHENVHAARRPLLSPIVVAWHGYGVVLCA
jgi:hypothetical protein